MESMTGFGTHTLRTDAFTLTVESRSVNGKALSTSVSLPEALSGREEEVDSAVRRRFARGRVRVSAVLRMPSGATRSVRVDGEVLKLYLEAAIRLFQEPGIESRLSVGELLGLPGVATVTGPAEADPEELSRAFSACLEASLEGLLTSRREEGASVAALFREAFVGLRGLVEPVLRDQRANVERRFTRLKERVSRLLGDAELDPDRMLQELALLADRVDVSEEVNRLLRHLDHAGEVLEADSPDTGRTLGFILQEMHREVNTLGSKSDDPDLSVQVVAMKNILAQLKEQVANVQ